MRPSLVWTAEGGEQQQLRNYFSFNYSSFNVRKKGELYGWRNVPVRCSSNFFVTEKSTTSSLPLDITHWISPQLQNTFFHRRGFCQ